MSDSHEHERRRLKGSALGPRQAAGGSGYLRRGRENGENLKVVNMPWKLTQFLKRIAEGDREV